MWVTQARCDVKPEVTWILDAVLAKLEILWMVKKQDWWKLLQHSVTMGWPLLLDSPYLKNFRKRFQNTVLKDNEFDDETNRLCWKSTGNWSLAVISGTCYERSSFIPIQLILCFLKYIKHERLYLTTMTNNEITNTTCSGFFWWISYLIRYLCQYAVPLTKEKLPAVLLPP